MRATTQVIRTQLTRSLGRYLPWAAAAARDAGLGHAQSILPAAVLASRYGTIYWIVPAEAGALLRRCRGRTAELDRVADWLVDTAWHNRVFNAAVAAFIRASRFSLASVDQGVPRLGFQARDGRRLYCRPSLARLNPKRALAMADPVFDLHDVAHLAAAALCPPQYGVKLHDPRGLPRLPSALTDLVAGFDAAQEPHYADGAIFSRFLHEQFFELELADEDETKVAERLSDAVVPFLLGRRALRDWKTHEWVAPEQPITAYELAMNVQNQAYERPASEIEQLLFVRGGADGRDALESLPASERLRAIAGLRGRTYHERRNIGKRRAQVRAYETVGSHIAADGARSAEERTLARLTLTKLRFEPNGGERPLNLFVEVARVLTAGGAGRAAPAPRL